MPIGSHWLPFIVLYRPRPTLFYCDAPCVRARFLRSFTVPEAEALPLLRGQFDVQGARAQLGAGRKKPPSESDLAEWDTLVGEVVAALNSKQLVPAMRTQYMRTAFQVRLAGSGWLGSLARRSTPGPARPGTSIGDTWSRDRTTTWRIDR